MTRRSPRWTPDMALPLGTEPKPRRRFSAEYKLWILREAAAMRSRGELAALLRREGLYSSHLTLWRAQAERAELEALAPKQRGPKTARIDPRDKRIVELERENERLLRRVERAELLLEYHRREVAQLLGLASKTAADMT
jgi:transposase